MGHGVGVKRGREGEDRILAWSVPDAEQLLGQQITIGRAQFDCVSPRGDAGDHGLTVRDPSVDLVAKSRTHYSCRDVGGEGAQLNRFAGQ